MTEFTKEQEAEIQKRIDAARIEQAKVEQFRIASDQFYREALTTLAAKVQAGIYDGYVLEVGKLHYAEFRTRFMPKQDPPAEPEPAGADDGTETD